jgi:enoyl-CoA hydratase
MSYDSILVEDRNGVIIVTINRPQALNALNNSVFEDLIKLMNEDLPSREGLKGVVFTGAGEKAFVAGADIKEFLDLPAGSGGEGLAKRGHDTFFSIENFHKPIVAAVNGFALGGGCELAMACHMRVAGEKARFGQPEVNLGLIPGYGGTQRLTQLIGKARAMEYTLTADMISASKALEIGLVNHVVEPGTEVEKAIEIIEKIASKAPLAVAKSIEAINAAIDESKNGYQVELDGFKDLTMSEDFKEGASAFIEKRKANFKGA